MWFLFCFLDFAAVLVFLYCLRGDDGSSNSNRLRVIPEASAPPVVTAERLAEVVSPSTTAVTTEREEEEEEATHGTSCRATNNTAQIERVSYWKNPKAKCARCGKSVGAKCELMVSYPSITPTRRNHLLESTCSPVRSSSCLLETTDDASISSHVSC